MGEFGYRDLVPEFRKVGRDTVDERTEVDRACLFAPHVLADERERLLRHPIRTVTTATPSAESTNTSRLVCAAFRSRVILCRY